MYEAHPSVYLPLLCVANYLRNHLSKSALDDHLPILRLATHSNIKELTSQHNLLSKYSHLKSEVTKILVSPVKKCPSILSMKEDDQNEPELRQKCGYVFIKSIHRPCFILRIPIEKQLLA